MTKRNREAQLTAIMAVPPEQLSEAIDALPKNWSIAPSALPQAGLGMLKLRESAMGEVFYLGEFPIAQCQLEVTTADGQKAIGGALIMDDQIARAEQLAICDAILTARLPGWERIAALVELGERARAERMVERKAILARTRVDFSLLDDVGAASDD